eukprot:6085090-Pleurochrysis_carterae.AAC.1
MQLSRYAICLSVLMYFEMCDVAQPIAPPSAPSTAAFGTPCPGASMRASRAVAAWRRPVGKAQTLVPVSGLSRVQRAGKSSMRFCRRGSASYL